MKKNHHVNTDFEWQGPQETRIFLTIALPISMIYSIVQPMVGSNSSRDSVHGGTLNLQPQLDVSRLCAVAVHAPAGPLNLVQQYNLNSGIFS